MKSPKKGRSSWILLLRHTRLIPSLLALAVPALTMSATPAVKPRASVHMAKLSVEERVEALLSRMTLHEKVGQLTQVGMNIPGPAKETTAEMVRNGQAGSVLWTLDSKEIQQLQEIAVRESRMQIPLLFGFDVIHGYKTLFPIPLGLASSWDPALVERMHAMAAHEATVSGITWNFSPMVDISRDARWGRMLEGAGEDSYLGCAMARAQVRGIQGPSLGTPHRMLGCVKHFAGYGAGEGGRDYDSCLIPDVAFHNIYLPPFKAAIDEGVGSVMSAYMCLNDVPATGNLWLMKDILRGELGFRGLTISDSWSVASMTAHGFARDEEEAALLGANAGVDIDMGSTTYLRQLPKLVASGRIPMETIDAMVREVLATKIRMGLFERPYAELEKKDAILNNPEHRAAAREAAQRSIVMLRNENRLLPLQKSLRKVALIGPLADSADDIKGPWTAEWSPSVTVLEALRAKLPEATIDFVRGGDMQRAYALPWDARAGKPAPTLMPEAEMQQELEKAVVAARNSELVILVLGERANMSGEAASSASLALGGNQLELLRAVVATGKPVVLVLLNGRPLDITWASSRVPSIVEAWFPGSEGGHAICDILFGDVNPGAKLPVSWPRSAGQSPTYYNHNHTQARETEAAFTSRYADQDSKPLYAFGHGLSYTTFAYSKLSLDRTELKPDGQLRVTVEVENTGTRSGDEVVQLYLHQRAGSAVRPVRELKGFQRVTLAAGEKRQVEFTLGKAELQFWSPKSKAWVVETESFDLWVGGDSNASLHSEFSIKP